MNFAAIVGRGLSDQNQHVGRAIRRKLLVGINPDLQKNTDRYTIG